MDIASPLLGDDESTSVELVVQFKILMLSWQGLYQDLDLSSSLVDNKHQGGNCSDLDLEDFVYAHQLILSR